MVEGHPTWKIARTRALSATGAKLIATWEHMGLGADYQRAQLGERYGAAKADLAQYRHLKALSALAEMRARASGEMELSDVRTAALRILASGSL